MKRRIYSIAAIAILLQLFPNDGFAQAPVDWPAPDVNLFLEPMVKPINQASPSQHPLLSSWPGSWTLNTAKSDEFNGYTLDASNFPDPSKKWVTNYLWGNTHAHHLSYNNETLPNQNNTNVRDPNSNFWFPSPGANGYLRMICQKETVIKRVEGYSPDDKILWDGRPNLRTFEYTSAMLMSQQMVGSQGVNPNTNEREPYGFIEIRCKIPASRNVIADFWFYNASESQNHSFHNEIDFMECENGDNFNMTTHTRDLYRTGNVRYSQHNYVNTLDVRKFSDDFNTYSLRWEPNKLIFYINNQIVRVETDFVADHLLSLIMNLELDEGTLQNDGRGLYTDANYPNYYDIDYIRIYNRATPIDQIPYPEFTINDIRSSSLTTPVPTPINSFINFNGIESFSPDGNYKIAINEYNTSLAPTTHNLSASSLTASEIAGIQKMDFALFCANRGYTLYNDYTYQIVLTVAGVTYPNVSKTMYIKRTPFVNSNNFKLNGRNTSLIIAEYDFGFPKIHFDGSAATYPISYNVYWLYVQLSNSSGTGIGPVYGRLLTVSEKNTISDIDFNQFAASVGLPLQYNNYYKVTYTTGSPAVSTSKLLRILPVTNLIDFSINGDNGGTSNQVNVSFDLDNPFQPPLFLEGYRCKTADNSASPFLVSVETSDQWWGRAGDEKTGWYSANDIKRLDLRSFATTKGLAINYGGYYRVSIATNNPFTSKVLLLHLLPCTNHPDFTINSQHRTDNTPVVINGNAPIMLSTWQTPWNSISCYPNKYHFLSIMECNYAGVVIANSVESMAWLNDVATIYTGRPGYTNLGWFDLRKFALGAEDIVNNPLSAYPAHNAIQLTNGKYYRIKLCTGGPYWDCHETIIYLDMPHRIGQFPSDSLEANVSLYPNPASNVLTVNTSENFIGGTCDFLTVEGRLVRTENINAVNNQFSIEDLPAGIYFLRISNGNLVKTEKLVVSKNE